MKHLASNHKGSKFTESIKIKRHNLALEWDRTSSELRFAEKKGFNKVKLSELKNKLEDITKNINLLEEGADEDLIKEAKSLSKSSK